MFIHPLKSAAVCSKKDCHDLPQVVPIQVACFSYIREGITAKKIHALSEPVTSVLDFIPVIWDARPSFPNVVEFTDGNCSILIHGSAF